MTEAKPYQIPKRLVWDAWKQVKANRGAAGVDGVSVEAFEKDLKRNLYKIWNRMSSGTYFPPPVRLVEIPKANGRSARWASTPSLIAWRRRSPRWSSNRKWNQSSTPIHTDIGPAVRRWMRWGKRVSAAGNSIG